MLLKAIKEHRLDFIDVIVLSSYYIFVCFLFLSIFGYFSRMAVFFVVIVLLLAILFLRKSIIFSKKYLWFFLIVPPAMAGFPFLKGFLHGDSYIMWLPISRAIAQTGFMPEFFIGQYFARMPLPSLLFAGTFSLLNVFSEYVCLWVPFFFTASALVVIYKWAGEKGLGKYFLFFLPFLFLTNYSVTYYGGWGLLTEAPLLFFATAFFYYYEKYLSDGDRRYLVLLILSFVLTCSSKVSGFFLVFIVIFIFARDKNKRIVFAYLLFFSIPIILWLARNYLVFDNPFFPLLNSFFKGRYYIPAERFSFYHTGLSFYNEHIWNKLGTIAASFLMAFPYLLLSFYELFKQRRYDYLFLIGFYGLFKEIFLFTPTVSNVRYYYFILGLLLVYGLLGLKRIKSRIFISFLILLAIGGLFLLPVTDSVSPFISMFENTFSSLGVLFSLMRSYWYLVMIILAPFAFWASKKDNVKMFLILPYCLCFFHISFIANKSWLNTWIFVLLVLIFLFIFIFKEKIKHLKQIIVIFIVFAFFTNSWAMASVYYWNHGGIQYPAPYLWEVNRWAEDILDEQTKEIDKSEFYVLATAQREYYVWLTDYQVLNFLDQDFWIIAEEYNDNLSDFALWQLLTRKRIKYIIVNGIDVEFDDNFNKELKRFYNSISNFDKFELIADREGEYFIWKVY